MVALTGQKFHVSQSRFFSGLYMRLTGSKFLRLRKAGSSLIFPSRDRFKTLRGLDLAIEAIK